jgi:two-component system OmpR family response regulator
VRVLIVEDEADLASALKRLLEDAGCSADIAEDGEAGLTLALDHAYDLVVLDLMLPRLQGEHIVGELRSRGRDVPVLVLTARDQVGDRVKLLDAGADDYVIKPFEPAELVSRARALVRRTAGHSSPVIALGDVTIDVARRTIARAGVLVAVTPREFRVLEYLALHRGAVVSRDELMTHLYSDEDDTWSNVLEV